MFALRVARAFQPAGTGDFPVACSCPTLIISNPSVDFYKLASALFCGIHAAFQSLHSASGEAFHLTAQNGTIVPEHNTYR